MLSVEIEETLKGQYLIGLAFYSAVVKHNGLRVVTQLCSTEAREHQAVIVLLIDIQDILWKNWNDEPYVNDRNPCENVQ